MLVNSEGIKRMLFISTSQSGPSRVGVEDAINPDPNRPLSSTKNHGSKSTPREYRIFWLRVLIVSGRFQKFSSRMITALIAFHILNECEVDIRSRF